MSDLDAELLRHVSSLRDVPAEAVVWLEAPPSPAVDLLARGAGRVPVKVGDRVALVAPASSCRRCSGSSAYRLSTRVGREAVTLPCECVSRQVRRTAP